MILFGDFFRVPLFFESSEKGCLADAQALCSFMGLKHAFFVHIKRLGEQELVYYLSLPAGVGAAP